MDDYKLVYIADLIREGYDMGFDPYWNLKATPDVLSDDGHREYIAYSVAIGFTSGIDPTWSIQIGKDDR